MVTTKARLKPIEIPSPVRHTARRPALEVLVAPAAKAARELADARRVSRVVGKTAHRVRPMVKGPIRCHKCRLNCTDAEHYLSHKCEAHGQA